jgi:lipopolysaccharide transport system ATP-binding protein
MSARISVSNVSLDIPIYVQRERNAKGWGSIFLGAAFDPPTRRVAKLLEDVSFELREGDRLAILGRNGAGKSTLLRVLNRVYEPTSGSVSVVGSCQALLNMSLGFSAEATVRENIFLRGIAMGLTASYLRHQIDPILEFSGLQEKASHRLRTLSSGQRMRLGFAISTCTQNDIILMDEWVGAGDAEFMAKAQERMRSRVGGSKILALASHSIGLLRDICNKGIVLEHGRVVHSGDIVSALKRYHDLLAGLREQLDIPPSAMNASRGAQVYGCAESVTITNGMCVVTGWMVNTEGSVPRTVVLVVNGRRYVAGDVQNTNRADVARHLGLADHGCGFLARFAIKDANSVGDLGDDIQVFGGESPEQADAPLRIAPGFTGGGLR